MRSARRDLFLSAAQVAYHYGGYTLETAIELDHDKRDLLLAVARDEQVQVWDRLGRILGTKWSLRQLLGVLDDEKKVDPNAPPKPLPSSINIPLLMAAAPEFFGTLIKEYKDKYHSALATMGEAGGGSVVELGTLSSADARDIYKRIGSMVAGTPPTPPEE